jgi:rhodanese-related sulfurtransferase
LKQQNAAVKVLGVYPEDGHDIPGVRSKRQLAQTNLYFPHEYDGETEATDRESYDLCLRLNREESIIAGPSSGMALAGAIRMVPDEPGVVAVVIFPDNIFKYASSVCRHFPNWCPAPAADTTAVMPSAGEVMLAALLENLKNPFDSVAATQLAGELGTDAAPLVVDVRTAEQFAAGHVPGAVNIPQAELAARAAELPADRDAPIVMVCSIGRTSKETILYLKSLGYRRARNLKGGVTEWIRKGHEVEKGTSSPAKP